MFSWGKLQRLISILFLCSIVASVLLGCKQVTVDKHGAIYGAITLTAQNNHSGVIVSAKNGSAVAQGVTDQTGMYVITDLPTGVYEVTVSKNGWYVKDSGQPTKSVVIVDGEYIMNVDYVMDTDLIPPAIPN